MNNQEWGVTERGFHRPTYVELLDAIEYKARELFGSKANLTVRSPLGIFLRIFAWMLNILFSLMEDVYNSRFVDTAVGTSLYNLGKAIGLSLLPAQKASGYVEFTGAAGTPIPVGFLVRTVAGLQYAVLAAGRIDDTGKVTLPVQAVETGADYNVAAETVKEITNPMDGVSACTNPAAIDGGRGRETDEEFRDRYYQSDDYAAASTRTPSPVKSCRTWTRFTPRSAMRTTQTKPTPWASPRTALRPSSTAAWTPTSRRPSSGARRRASKPPAALLSPSSLRAARASISSFPGRPPLPCISKSRTWRPTATSPATGQDRIKEALVEYIGGDVRGGLTIGSDVLYMALPGVILSVPGVVDFDLGISETASDYGEENIVIDTREKAVTSTDKITIAEVS